MPSEGQPPRAEPEAQQQPEPQTVPGFLVCRLRSGQALVIGQVELIVAECRSGHVELAIRAPRDVRIRRVVP